MTVLTTLSIVTNMQDVETIVDLLCVIVRLDTKEMEPCAQARRCLSISMTILKWFFSHKG